MGLLLAAGLSTAPAGASATSTAKTSPAGTVQPQTLSSCLAGMNNSYEFYTWCKGTSPTSFRTIAYCADGEGVLGAEYQDGSGSLSYANCQIDGLNSTLNADWGILWCSNNNGTGTYQGYANRASGDISWMLAAWGNGSISTGGTTICEWDTNNETYLPMNAAP